MNGRHAGVVLTALVVAATNATQVGAQFNCDGIIQEPSYASRSVINRLGLTITVRDQFGTEQPGCPLNLTILSVVNSYGHQHSGNRPVGSLSVTTCNTGADGEQCNTIWTAPEVSGQMVLQVTPNPSGATCSNGFPIGTSNFAMCVQLDGLNALTGGTGYTLTGFTSTHPDNHYATSALASAVQSLALRYSNETGQTMGVNDMSLVKGGLFDYKPGVTPWQPPHASHRLGVDTDIDLPPAQYRRRFLQMVADANSHLVRIREPGTLTHFHLRLK